MAATTKVELDPKYDNYDFPVVAPVAQKGHSGHTTDMENAQIFQLRTMLEAAGFTERLDTLTLVCTCLLVCHVFWLITFQLRFLRARKFDVKLAQQM
jgi:hypothetical protein